MFKMFGSRFFTFEVVLNLLKTLIAFNIIMNKNGLYHGDIKSTNIII